MSALLCWPVKQILPGWSSSLTCQGDDQSFVKSFRKAEQTEESLREKREEFLERGRAELYAGGKETPLDRRERYKKDLEDTKGELEEVKSDLKRVTGGDAKRELQEDQLAMFASEFGTNERHFCSWYVVCCLDVISRMVVMCGDGQLVLGIRSPNLLLLSYIVLIAQLKMYFINVALPCAARESK